MEMIAAPPPSLPVPLLEVPLRAQLLAHVPEIVTSVLIPDGQASKEGFLEFCYKDILEALKPRTTAATEEIIARLPDPQPRIVAGAQRSRYSNIIEQLERKYCGSRTAAVLDDEEEETLQPKKKRRRRKANKGEGKVSAEGGPEGDDGDEAEHDELSVDDSEDFYDSEDSFIDDSAADHDIQSAYNMKNVQTKCSGFFVSSGELEVMALPRRTPGLESDNVCAADSDDVGDISKSNATKSPAKSSQQAVNSLRKAIRRRMVELVPGRFPEEIANDISKAVATCKKNYDFRWCLKELTEILKPTSLSSSRIKKHVLACIANETDSGVNQKKNFDAKMKKAVDGIEELLNRALAKFVSGKENNDAVTFIRRANATALNGINQLSVDPLLSSIDALADQYMKIWAALWEDSDLIAALHLFQDVCKSWASKEAAERVAKELISKSSVPSISGSSAGPVAMIADEMNSSQPAPVIDGVIGNKEQRPHHLDVIDLSQYTQPTVGEVLQSQGRVSPAQHPLKDAVQEARMLRTKILFATHLRKWWPSICSMGYLLIKSACVGGPGNEMNSTAISSMTSNGKPVFSDDESLIVRRFAVHLKNLHKKRKINWNDICWSRKTKLTNSVIISTEAEQQGVEFIPALEQRSAPKKLPKKKIVNSSDLGVQEAIIIPPSMQRTHNGASSPSAISARSCIRAPILSSVFRKPTFNINDFDK